jgi:DNA topoisomerase-1
VAKGISRQREKRAKAREKTPGFVYFGPDGKRITARATIERCNKLAISPAWKDAWISPRPRADLQATGRDAKGRLQYRYHKNWTDARAAEKFDGMTAFAAILPSIRKRIHLDLAQEGLPKSKVVALVIKLIDLYHFRIGNDEYAKMNRSYGLTTLTEGHMTIDRSSRAEGKLDAIFEFAGKSGKLWRKRIWEDDIAQLIVASGRVGGRDENQDLFRYEDESRRDHDIKAFHINEYLDASTGDARRVTAKAFVPGPRHGKGRFDCRNKSIRTRRRRERGWQRRS